MQFVCPHRGPFALSIPANCITYFRVCPNITVALAILEVVMAARSSLDRRVVSFREPNSHRTRTEHVQNEEYFSVRREPATVMLTLLFQTFDINRNRHSLSIG